MFSNLFRSRDWLILGPMGLLAIALGYWGFLECDPSRPCHVVSHADAFFRSIGLLRLTGNYVLGPDPWQLVIAQFALPAMALLGGAKLLLVNLRRDVRVALAHRARNHIIVCGLSDTGRHVVEGFVDAGRAVVAITLDSDDPNSLACENLGVAVLKGDASQVGMLALAGLKRAEAVVMTTGSDAQNLEIGLRAGDLLEAERGDRTVKLLAELRSDWLRDALAGHRTAVLGRKSAEMQLFNLYENSARSLLHSAAFARAFLEHGAHPHIVLAGFGSAGNEIVRHSIQTSFATPGTRLSVTIFDQNAEQAGKLFRLRSAGLNKLADFTFNSCLFADDDASSWLDIEKSLGGLRADMVVVALASDEDSLRAALQFRASLDRLGQLETPVFVRLRHQRKLGEFMRQVEGHALLPDRLISFGDLKQLACPDMLLGTGLDHLARAAHQAYLESIGPTERSPAAVPWERLPERFKQSNRALADHMPILLRTGGYRLVPGDGAMHPFEPGTIERLAKAAHWRWCVEQWSAGWVYGEHRDDVRRLHPLLRDWNEIPEDIRNWNRDQVQRIPAIARKAGYMLCRERIVPLSEPDSDAAGLPPDITPILVVDPADSAQIDKAGNIVASRKARIRLIWRGAQRLNNVEERLISDSAFSAAIEGWISPPC
ncbi:MAG: NAD-binding protein [Rhizomicrobium sp.]